MNSMPPEPSLYTGTLRHRRFRPRGHQFRYKLFMAWLDIDRITEQMAETPWTSWNRFAWASFHERDHFGDSMLPLRERLRKDANQNGITLPDGPIYLLTHLRYLGYCFNPISFFFCYRQDGSLDSVLAEVNSTFGETHNYWLTARNRQAGEKSLRYRCPKAMHVSPFMGMSLDYEFVLTQPAEQLVAHMNTIEQGNSGGVLFDATLELERVPWNSRNVGRALLRHPWMTAQVILAIHWEALRLFLKKVPVFTHPGRIRAAVEELPKRS
jgi:DUF1365 family protein